MSRGDPEHVSDADRAGAMVRSMCSLLEEQLEPIGASPGDRMATLVLPGHFIPAPFSMASALCQLPSSESSLSFTAWFGSFMNWATQIAA
jgi:hypothetical protein